MTTDILDLKKEFFSYIGDEELNNQLWNMYQEENLTFSPQSTLEIIERMIDILSSKDVEETRDLREHVCQIVYLINKNKTKEEINDVILSKAMDIEPLSMYAKKYPSSCLRKLSTTFSKKYIKEMVEKYKAGLTLYADKKINSYFYSDYAFLLYLQSLDAKKLDDDILKLLNHAISINDKNPSAYLYKGYVYDEFYKEFGLDYEEKLSICGEMYEKSLSYGSAVASKKLKKIKEQQTPSCWIELMNADIHLKSLVASLEKSKVQAFSMLLYGPHGSGKEEFAKKLLEKLELSYEEYSIADTEKTIQAKIRELKEDKKAYIIKYSERMFFNIPNSINTTPDSMSYLLQDILRLNQHPIFLIVDDINKIDINLASSFTFRIGFDFMDKAQKDIAYKSFFKKEPPKELDKITKLVLEDFSRTVRKAKALGCMDNQEEVFSILKDEVKFKYQGQEYTSNGNSFSDELINSSIDLTTITDKLCSLKSNFTMLIYGPPGTGKSYYLRYLAERLGCKMIEKTAADLFSKYQGEPARKVSEIFKQQENEKAILILDEVDEILKSRESLEGNQGWKTDMINAFLTSLDRAKYPVACTTNFIEKIDPAILRRFTFKIKFDYLTQEQNEIAYSHFFKKKAPLGLEKIKNLTNGDFSTVKRQSILLDYSQDDEKILEALDEEVKRKLGDNYIEYDSFEGFDIDLINTNHAKLKYIEQIIQKDDNAKIALLGPDGIGKKTYIRYISKMYEKTYKICNDTDFYTRGYIDSQLVKQVFESAKDAKSILVFDNVSGLTAKTSNQDVSLTQILSNITKSKNVNSELLEQIKKYKYPIFILSNDKNDFISRDKLRTIISLVVEFDYLNKKQINKLYRKTFGVSLPIFASIGYKNLTPLMMKNISSTINIMGINTPKDIYKIFNKELEKEKEIHIKRIFAKILLCALGISSLLYFIRLIM
ncbi:MAG: ATP-binding protein [Alphaproteobacteria bacterium]|nr:ATP-binding protein [Alphaproteobacteria bacterium]